MINVYPSSTLVLWTASISLSLKKAWQLKDFSKTGLRRTFSKALPQKNTVNLILSELESWSSGTGYNLYFVKAAVSKGIALNFIFTILLEEGENNIYSFALSLCAGGYGAKEQKGD